MFILKNGQVYQGTGNDKNDILQLLADYMAEYGGRRPTSDELSALGKDAKIPKDLSLYSIHHGNLKEAISKASWYVPKNNPNVLERNEIIKRATDLLIARGVKHFDADLLSELKISDELMKKYFNGVSDLEEETKPGLVAAEVRRRREAAKKYAAEKDEAEKKNKEVEKQMKEKNKETDREVSTSSNHLASKINIPNIKFEDESETKPEVKSEAKPESKVEPESKPEAEPVFESDSKVVNDSGSEESVIESSDYSDEDYEAYEVYEEDCHSEGSESDSGPKTEPESESKAEIETQYEIKPDAKPDAKPEPEIKPDAKPDFKPKSNHKKKKRGGDSEKIEISDAELDEIASILDMNGSVLKNYYLLCQHRGYVVLQGELAQTTTLLREKKGIREILPCWDFLKKTFGPSCLYDALFGLPFKERYRTVSRAESQKAQLSPEELEMHNEGKRRLQGFLDSNWENSQTRRKPNRLKGADSGVATKVQQIAERVSSEAEGQEKKVVADVPVETKEEDMGKNDETTEETREEERIKENNFPNKKEVVDTDVSESSTTNPNSNTKVSVIKVGNGMVQVTITREPITMAIPEGVHINMNVSLPEETVNVVI